MAKKTAQQQQQLAALDREYEERKSKILTPPVKKPPITTPVNAAWTVELIERLKKYIDGSRYFIVYFQSHRIFGMDLVPEEYAGDYAPDCAEFFLQEYDDARPEGHDLGDCDPSDFHVYLLKPVVEWETQDPNWQEADPESWAESQREQE